MGLLLFLAIAWYAVAIFLILMDRENSQESAQGLERNTLRRFVPHPSARIACMKKTGKITIPPDVNVWPHELKTAQALIAASYDVEFVRRSEEAFATSADILMDGEIWEMKSPTSDKLKRIEKRLREAKRQSSNVVFDSRRMKKLPDDSIKREVMKQAELIRSIKRLIYIARDGSVCVLKGMPLKCS